MAETSTPVAELREVSRVFGAGEAAVTALAGVSLDFAAGRFHAVLGPSGSGKSTLLHVLAGLDPPTTGTVRVLGHDLGTLDDAALARLRRRSVGLVFQFFNLLPSLSVQENALLPLLLDRSVQQADLERLGAVLDRLGIGARRHELPERLSGGERQRAAIARALLPRPPLLLADEPTGSLDSVNGAAVTATLRRLADEDGVCVVVVTHDPRVAEQADVVIHLADGRVASGGGGAPAKAGGRAV